MTDPVDVTAAKAALRIEARARRKAMSHGARAVACESMCALIVASEAFADAEMVLAYVPVGSEADVLGVAAAAFSSGKRVAIPRTDGEALVFDEVEAATLVSLAPGLFGIPVAPRPRPVMPTASTLVLVPLLAFDQRGNRLGSGKGFYDRFLASFPGSVIGVAFADQEVARVPTEPHDRRLGAVVTDLALRFTVDAGVDPAR